MKKNCKKENKKEFRIEKLIKRKGDKLYISNGKDMAIHLIVGLIKKHLE